MTEKIVYRLECDSHFWNFPSFEAAEKAAKEYRECLKYGIDLKKVVEFYDECGKLLSTKEQRLYNETRPVSDPGRLSLH